MILIADSEDSEDSAYCADAQTGLDLRCPHMPEDTFSHGAAYLIKPLSCNYFWLPTRSKAVATADDDDGDTTFASQFNISYIRLLVKVKHTYIIKPYKSPNVGNKIVTFKKS